MLLLLHLIHVYVMVLSYVLKVWIIDEQSFILLHKRAEGKRWKLIFHYQENFVSYFWILKTVKTLIKCSLRTLIDWKRKTCKTHCGFCISGMASELKRRRKTNVLSIGQLDRPNCYWQLAFERYALVMKVWILYKSIQSRN